MKIIIYVRLLNEGEEVFRPVKAVHTEGDIYQITQVQPSHEEWEYKTGSKVVVQKMNLSDGPCLIASGKIP